MGKRIGFVLNAPLNFSETFLKNEFTVLKELGYEIILFEGYSKQKQNDVWKTVKSLPLSIHYLNDISHILKTFILLFFTALIPLIRFISLELKERTGLLRILKRIWFNAHILSHRVDYLHFCFSDVALQKELVAKALKARMSVSLRGSDILIYSIKNKGCYQLLWKEVDKVHAVSNYIFFEALKSGLNKEINHQIIYDAIDPEVIKFNSSDIHEPVQLISVGRLESVKDHEFALKIIVELIRSQVKVKYTIVGDGSLRDFLESMIRNLKIEQHVELKGKLEHDDVLAQIPSYDILIHTSKSEGLGVAILEAQAAGLLTITVNTGSSHEIIEDEKTGWIVQQRDPVAFSNKIQEILKMTGEKRLSIKRDARKRIYEKFNIKKTSSLWKSFFEE